MTANDGDPTNNIGTASKTVTIANVAPTVVLTGDTSANEGQTKTYTYTVTDPGTDPPTVTESCGANATKTDTPAANSFDCTFPDGPGSSTVSVTANDGDPTNNTGRIRGRLGRERCADGGALRATRRRTRVRRRPTPTR